jgi:hypothetical protein
MLASLINFWKGLDQKKKIIAVAVPLLIFVGIMAIFEDKTKDDVKKFAISECRAVAVGARSDRATAERLIREHNEVRQSILQKYPDAATRNRMEASFLEFRNIPRNREHFNQGRCDSMSW